MNGDNAKECIDELVELGSLQTDIELSQRERKDRVSSLPQITFGKGPGKQIISALPLSKYGLFISYLAQDITNTFLTINLPGRLLDARYVQDNEGIIYGRIEGVFGRSFRNVRNFFDKGIPLEISDNIYGGQEVEVHVGRERKTTHEKSAIKPDHVIYKEDELYLSIPDPTMIHSGSVVTDSESRVVGLTGQADGEVFIFPIRKIFEKYKSGQGVTNFFSD